MPTIRLRYILILAIVLITLVYTSIPLTQAQEAPQQIVRVATKPLEPFVLYNGDQLDGFSIELWNEVARRLNYQTDWERMETVTEILEAVQNQTADAAIAGISMTPEREQKVDFSHPFFDAGLQIMARADSRPTLLQWIRQFITPALLGLLAIGIIFSLIMGHVIWLVERRRNPDFQQGYLRGVWEGIWWLFGVIATGEYPDKETHSVIKRILTVGWWLIGVALIAQLTGTIASSMTVQQLQSSINGPQDLPGKHIITVQGSTAAQYLDRQSIRYSVVEQIQAAYPLLEDGKVDAIVYDSPVLLYYAANQGQGRVQVVGPIFKPEKYGIALQTGSQLRKPINEALLGIYQDGTYEILYQKWFGQGE